MAEMIRLVGEINFSRPEVYEPYPFILYEDNERYFVRINSKMQLEKTNLRFGKGFFIDHVRAEQYNYFVGKAYKCGDYENSFFYIWNVERNVGLKWPRLLQIPFYDIYHVHVLEEDLFLIGNQFVSCRGQVLLEIPLTDININSLKFVLATSKTKGKYIVIYHDTERKLYLIWKVDLNERKARQVDSIETCTTRFFKLTGGYFGRAVFDDGIQEPSMSIYNEEGELTEKYNLPGYPCDCDSKGISFMYKNYIYKREYGTNKIERLEIPGYKEKWEVIGYKEPIVCYREGNKKMIAIDLKTGASEVKRIEDRIEEIWTMKNTWSYVQKQNELTKDVICVMSLRQPQYDYSTGHEECAKEGRVCIYKI